MLKERCTYAWNQLTVEQQSKYRSISEFAKEWLIEECFRKYKEPFNFDELVTHILNNDKKAYERHVYQRNQRQ